MNYYAGCRYFEKIYLDHFSSRKLLTKLQLIVKTLILYTL